MEPDDPFGWIMDACQVSSSEESRLRHCSYFGTSDSDDSDSGWQNSPDIPVALTGITMVSPPESPQDELPNDQYIPEDQEIFHTPPESRSTSFNNCNDDRMIGNALDRDGETVVVDADSEGSRRAVDLGRDTDLGFLEVDSTQRIEANSTPEGTFPRELEGIGVLKRGFFQKGQLSTGSPSKRLKSLDFESPTKPLDTPKERNTNEILKSLKKWNFKKISLSTNSSSDLALEKQQNRNVSEGNLKKGRLDFSSDDFSTKDVECDTEERNVESENDNGEGNSGRNVKTERKRALPSWANNGRVGDEESADEEQEVIETELPSLANGRARDDERADEELEVNETELPSLANGRVGDDERADEELDVNERETVHLGTDTDSLSEDFEKSMLLDVLLKLEEDWEEDRSLECLSHLEVAERKWGTFYSDE